jgi:D-serine deaminase-like pyridoxal phosphate-dependent protein
LAKIFLESGVKDILIANEIVGDIKIQRLVNLSGYGDLIVCVDHVENARDISEAAGRMVWT